ncbi:MAG: DUF6873 family GME fold protein [Clostridia bacterium]
MFITTPYLPEGKVTLAVSAFPVPDVNIIPPPELKTLPEPLRRHADLGMCPIGGNEIVCPPDSYGYYSEILSPYGFSVIRADAPLGGSYPADTAYNVVVAGNYALLNPKVCDRTLLRLLENRFDILPIKQGYAKCSVAPVAENALITADAGIYKVAEKKGLDALLISNSGVVLPPYSNGFFGGACGMTDRRILAVNGSLKYMESGSEIIKFLEKYGVRVLEINSYPPFDTGSLIPLKINADNIL